VWAARIASDDFEHDIDLDSAGDRFGAKAEGGVAAPHFERGAFS
jgi:hypothetical protein